jgi:hypothetical protein
VPQMLESKAEEVEGETAMMVRCVEDLRSSRVGFQ